MHWIIFITMYYQIYLCKFLSVFPNVSDFGFQLLFYGMVLNSTALKMFMS